MHFKFEHDFDTDPKDFWDIFFDEEYNVELYRRLKMRERRVVEQKDDGETLLRTVQLTPDKEVPSFVRSLINDLSYTERNVYRRSRSEMEVVIEPAMMKNKFDFKAIYAVRPLGPGRCRRSFEGDAKVSVMLVGGKIEKFMIDEVRESYETATVVTREWIAKRKQQAAG